MLWLLLCSPPAPTLGFGWVVSFIGQQSPLSEITAKPFKAETWFFSSLHVLYQPPTVPGTLVLINYFLNNSLGRTGIYNLFLHLQAKRKHVLLNGRPTSLTYMEWRLRGSGGRVCTVPSLHTFPHPYPGNAGGGGHGYTPN